MDNNAEYQHTIDWLFDQLPQYQRIGPGAYKPGLDTSRLLDDAFGNPAGRLTVIHVAGTNGKGSTSHMLAAALQSAGLRVGLYTSPHLIDFRERIRIDGRMIDRQAVCDFVRRYRDMGLDCTPSFFELTSTMAFDWFARNNVDVAVIEVGLGGRLDSTNIVTPIVSVITNISLDHTALLGDTEAQIAAEKAGIIKPGIPVVIGEAEGDVRSVFSQKAAECGSPIHFAQDTPAFDSYDISDDHIVYHTHAHGDVTCDLTGDCQPRNMNTVLNVIRVLRESTPLAPRFNPDMTGALSDVCARTGLMGRWMRVSDHPTVICDTGHNIGGWQYIAPRLQRIADSGKPLTIIIGFVNDKDFSKILCHLPATADIIYTQADMPRALDCHNLANAAAAAGRAGTAIPTVAAAYAHALTHATADTTIFVGGSTFIVADLLSTLR